MGNSSHLPEGDRSFPEQAEPGQGVRMGFLEGTEFGAGVRSWPGAVRWGHPGQSQEGRVLRGRGPRAAWQFPRMGSFRAERGHR